MFPDYFHTLFRVRNIAAGGNPYAFGLTLDDACAGSYTVPPVMRMCVEHLESSGLSTVATYGQGGSALKVLEMKAGFNKGVAPNLAAWGAADAPTVARY